MSNSNKEKQVQVCGIDAKAFCTATKAANREGIKTKAGIIRFVVNAFANGKSASDYLPDYEAKRTA